MKKFFFFFFFFFFLFQTNFTFDLHNIYYQHFDTDINIYNIQVSVS